MNHTQHTGKLRHSFPLSSATNPAERKHSLPFVSNNSYSGRQAFAID